MPQFMGLIIVAIPFLTGLVVGIRLQKYLSKKIDEDKISINN